MGRQRHGGEGPEGPGTLKAFPGGKSRRLEQGEDGPRAAGGRAPATTNSDRIRDRSARGNKEVTNVAEDDAEGVFHNHATGKAFLSRPEIEMGPKKKKKSNSRKIEIFHMEKSKKPKTSTVRKINRLIGV